MLTASFLRYDYWTMSDAWRTCLAPQERRTSDLYTMKNTPFDFGALDAPEVLAAGSYVRTQSIADPGYEYPLPSTTHRQR